MRKLLILPLLLVLGGCAGLGSPLDSTGTSILKGGTSLTASIANPATPVTIYQVKSVYATALDLANSYRDYCYARPYAALMTDPIAGPACKKRRAVVTALNSASDKAADAIAKADAFIVANPTISAVSVVREAWIAVTSFQGAINIASASAAPVQ